MDGGDHLYGIQEVLGELCNRLSNAADEGYFFEVKFVKVKIRGYTFPPAREGICRKAHK